MNSGDLNNPDFDVSNFTGGYSGPPVDPTPFTTTAAATMEMPTAEELANMDLTQPAFYANYRLMNPSKFRSQ